MRDIRFLDRTAQYFTGLRHERQHRLQIQPASLPIADLAHAAHLRMMRKVHFRGVLHQQDDWPSLNVFARLLPMRLHQRLEGDIVFREQAVQGNRPFPGVHLVGQGP